MAQLKITIASLRFPCKLVYDLVKVFFFFFSFFPFYTQQSKILNCLGPYKGGSPCGVAANVLECDIVVSEFEPQSLYYVLS